MIDIFMNSMVAIRCCEYEDIGIALIERLFAILFLISTANRGNIFYFFLQERRKNSHTRRISLNIQVKGLGFKSGLITWGFLRQIIKVVRREGVQPLALLAWLIGVKDEVFNEPLQSLATIIAELWAPDKANCAAGYPISKLNRDIQHDS